MPTKKNNPRIQQPESVLQKALGRISVGVTITDNEGNIVYSNDAEAEMHGYRHGELVGKNVRILAPPDLWAPEKLKGGARIQSWRRESLNVRKDGVVFPVELASDILCDEKGGLFGLVTTCQDISERKRIEEDLARKALHDSLTGLPNRILFLDRLQHSLRRARRRKEHQFAVLFVDVDYFKLVNDTYGHLAGDELLKRIGERLVSCLRPDDTVARIGGDEFTILIDDVVEARQVLRLVRRVETEFQAPFHIGGRMIHTSVSIGIAHYKTGCDRAEDLLRNADAALYRAKAAGRACHVVFETTQNSMVEPAVQPRIFSLTKS